MPTYRTTEQSEIARHRRGPPAFATLSSQLRSRCRRVESPCSTRPNQPSRRCSFAFRILIIADCTTKNAIQPVADGVGLTTKRWPFAPNQSQTIDRFGCRWPKYWPSMESVTWGKVAHWRSVKILAMIPLLGHSLGWLIGAFRSREAIILENLALRQQRLTLHAKRPRPRLGTLDKLFWVG